MDDLGHEWGPHKGGIRWVQCQRCECLLHESEAKERCTASTRHVAARRADRLRALIPKFAEIMRRESGWR